MAQLTVPIVVDWDSIQKELDEHDIVEVVRCKDCEFKDGVCCDYSAVYVHDNGYCNWGRRRK